ncbi:Fe2+-dependent dioxygenase [Gammaproteobacteria bacterium ESL0073]|uniref:Fe2+-dependent dioxygenase n=1 Tax=Entomomonas moraniae TaxID=2213226 RepID=A0A451EPE1_9GAMM|nr:Fe2+-dependent dioxygenase [Entomomonas moraniae]AWM81498.1 Fe2+-dependent dioxygenase [Gammaproteobacteria bacterium ESL0073]AZS51666.1 Fe2+-dependent dioxygenase [Entomomonas moraniae]
MLLQIPNVFSKEEVRYIRQRLEQANWQDGQLTAGHIAINCKDNEQLSEEDPFAIELGDEIIKRLGNHPLFISAALPHKVFPPMFNRYQGGGTYGFHVDNAIRKPKTSSQRVRTDVSSTLFFSEPEEYEGGELVIQDTYGEQRVRLPAGDLVLYPSTSLHQVTPVTSGARYASFLWTQSMVRSDEKRRLLFDMDCAIQQLVQDVPNHPSIIKLSGNYHNLLRQWAEI